MDKQKIKKILKRLLLFALVLFILAVSYLIYIYMSLSSYDPAGVGPIKWGMTVEEAQKATGRTFTYAGQNKSGSITYYHDPGAATGPDVYCILPAFPLEIYCFIDGSFALASARPTYDPDKAVYTKAHIALTNIFGAPFPGSVDFWRSLNITAGLGYNNQYKITTIYLIQTKYFYDYQKDPYPYAKDGPSDLI